MLKYLLLAIVASWGVAGAQTKPKPKIKPKPKAVVAKPLLGTVQMPGDKGKIGTAYSMGAKGDELNFILESAEFQYRYPLASEDQQVADKTHKLLVLTFAVQNPQKSEMSLQWNSFRFTVVSPDDENEEYDGYYFHPERKERFSTTLKPAQKVRALAVIQVHPVGPVNKLIVKRGDDNPVLRYDLRGLVKPLTGPFAKNDGIDISDTGEAALNTSFALGKLDWTIEKVEPVEGNVGNSTPDENDKLWVVVASVKNANLQPVPITWNTITPSMKDGDGESIEYLSDFVGMNSEKTINTELAPGDSIRGKFIFEVAGKAKPAKLMLFDSLSERTIVIRLP